MGLALGLFFGLGSSGPVTNNASIKLVATLQKFFSNGCRGGCTHLNESASAFNVVTDPHNTTWDQWTVNDPALGPAYGFAHQSAKGTWQLVAGPGSVAVGCGQPEQVPRMILADFKQDCPPT